MVDRFNRSVGVRTQLVGPPCDTFVMDMETEFVAGTYNFSTATGSAYELIIDDVGATLERKPGKLPVHPSMDGAELSPLRRDTEAIAVIKVVRLVVSEPAIFMLDLRKDGIITLRTTSTVITLDRTH